MWASYEGFFEVALVLLNHGANANASAADIPANYTPLMLAARQGHILVLRLLLEWGSAIEATMGVSGLYKYNLQCRYLDVFSISEGLECAIPGS